jgi:hypothetical protein
MGSDVAGSTGPNPTLGAGSTRHRFSQEKFHQSRRVLLFGALQGLRRGVEPDLELLYVGAPKVIAEVTKSPLPKERP